MQLRQLALQQPPCLLQDVPRAGVQGSPDDLLYLQFHILRRSQRQVRDMQVASMLQPQRDLQHMQQKGMQQLLAKERLDQKGSHLPELLKAVEDCSS